MILKARRSPAPQEKYIENKNKKISSSLDNGVPYLAVKNGYNSCHLHLITFLITVGILLTFLNLYGLQQFQSQHLEFHRKQNFESNDKQLSNQSFIKKPIVWFSGQRIEGGYLKHVMEIFERLGFEKTFNGSDGNWDILWSHEYPFMNNFLPKLKPHQRVNHFPGSGFITNKVNLATSNLKHIPKAFNLPQEKSNFLKYAENNAEKLWVQKSNNHRGIRVENIEDLNLDASGTFIQEYIRNPLLVDGKKFDIGIYTTMTSINPLRVYTYNSDVLLRFCAKQYYPFNKTDLDSYVVGDDYTPTWEMPSLRKYFIDLNLNMKETLNSYLTSIGKNPQKIWTQIEDSIRTVYIEKEEMMLKVSTKYDSMRNFFEMVRFDFALDDELNVFLMEANMSPNLSSSHFGPNKLLYEQVIYNLLSLSGLATTLQLRSWSERPANTWNMMVSSKDLSVEPQLCSAHECHLSCRSSKCQVCYHCLTADTKLLLKDAVLEHFSKYNTRRIIPQTMDDSSPKAKGVANDLHGQWFRGKCQLDVSWCS